MFKAGSFRADAGYLGLQQELPADAAVDIFSSGLGPILQRWHRGYRAVQLGRTGRQTVLAAYAQTLCYRTHFSTTT
jgi:hypothetical protein